MTRRGPTREGLNLSALGYTAEEAYLLGLCLYNPREYLKCLTYEEILHTIRNQRRVERDINKIISTGRPVNPIVKSKLTAQIAIICKIWEVRGVLLAGAPVMEEEPAQALADIEAPDAETEE